MVEGNFILLTPNLTCSSLSTTKIYFEKANNGGSSPSWVLVDVISGELNITAPEVSTNTEFTFYINANIFNSTDTGFTNPLQK